MNAEDFNNAIENNEGHYLIKWCFQDLTKEQVEIALKNNK